jgi:hypothetical protein
LALGHISREARQHPAELSQADQEAVHLGIGRGGWAKARWQEAEERESRRPRNKGWAEERVAKTKTQLSYD